MNSPFLQLSEFEQDAIRHFSAKDFKGNSMEEYDGIASDKETLRRITQEYEKLEYKGFERGSPFTRLSTRLERMAIRYHLRKEGFSGDYFSKCDEIASDSKRMEKLVTDYKEYTSIA